MCGLGWGAAAHAQVFERASVGTSYEHIRLSGENLGLSSVHLSKQFAQHLDLGIVSYVAVRGQRGGFITLGVSADSRWPLRAGWSVEIGGFVGAGGGRNSLALSGGGLMLRGQLGLGLDLDRISPLPGRLSLGLSHVEFPNGTLSSTQPYLAYAVPFKVFTRPGWSDTQVQTLSPDALQQLAPRTHDLGLSLRRLKVAPGTRNDSGMLQRNLDLLGVEWRTQLGDKVYARLETGGAMGGGATGYMQVLGGVGWREPLTPRLAARVHAAIGGGGGGGVDTSGGLLVDTGLSLQWHITPDWYAEAALQRLQAPSGQLKANSVALQVGHTFGRAGLTGSAAGSAVVFEPHALRLRFANQTYRQASSTWRTQFADLNVQNLGVQVDAFLTPHLYLSGQGLGAWKGDAGAYMTGQVGVGGHIALGKGLGIELEGLVGAAGGGGLEVGSGLVAQVNTHLVWQATDTVSVHAGVGRLHALRNDFRANVVGLAVGYRFTTFSAR